jgi:branched-chain amino acid transport system permease protein
VAVASAPAELRGRAASGVMARAIVAALIVVLVLVLPVVMPSFFGEAWADKISLAAIYAVFGLSVNVITGHAGQISLGQQAFVGIGAFTSAYLVTQSGLSFFLALPIAGLTGGLMAMALGLVALRIRGLYLALITLSFGIMAQSTIFNIRAFTGGGEGAFAPRPAQFEGDRAYAYLCLLVLGLFLFLDWRLVKSKAGRGIVSVRNDERVAATLGINVVGYKLLAFVIGGFVAGVGGALFAHQNLQAQALDYEFKQALVWVVMAVVGGLGSRAGVVLGSAFFAIFTSLMPAAAQEIPTWLPLVGGRQVLLPVLAPLLGAMLLLLTVTKYPGGIGQQILPLRRWLAGGPFMLPRHAKVVDENPLTPEQLSDEIGEEIAHAEEQAEASAPARGEA